MSKTWYKHITPWSRSLSWPLLLLLIGVINVKLVVKIIVLLSYLIIYRKELLPNKEKIPAFIWFYASMICIGTVNFFLAGDLLNKNYLVVVLLGIGFWGLCIAASLIAKMLIEKTATTKITATIKFFFQLNFLITAFQLFIIMIDAGALNPYTYQGQYQKYFISTGDRMTGISFDISTTNAILSAFGVFYFLYRQQFVMLLLCMITLLATGSNFIFLLTLASFFVIFLFSSNRLQKSSIILCLALFVIFLARVSPQNNRYANTVLSEKVMERKINADQLSIAKTESTSGIENQKLQIARSYIDSINAAHKNNPIPEPQNNLVASVIPDKKPTIPTDNIHSAPFQRKKDSTGVQKKLLGFMKENGILPDSSTSPKNQNNRAGKLISFRQTYQYLVTNPRYILSGTGIGNFSSKLAFRATGLNIAGSYPPAFSYVNAAFNTNHLHLYLQYFSEDAEKHSLLNSPDSAADQLLAEYGILGILSFLLLYIGYFLKTTSASIYALPALILLAGSLLTGYWFEQLSIVIIFEVLMLLHVKQKKDI
jgi:hypothetical protein